MSDVLSVKVRLELNAMEADKDLRNQLNKMQIPPVTVDLKIGKILNKEELNSLDFTNIKNEFKSIFDIDRNIIQEIKDVGNVLEKVVNGTISSNTVAKFKEMSSILGEIGKSFELDTNVINKFDKLNSILKEFNGLSADAQKALLKPATGGMGLKDSIEKEMDDAENIVKSSASKMSKVLEDIEWSILNKEGKREFDSLTKYLDSSATGLKAVTKKQLDAFSVLTEQSFGDGSKVRNIAVDVEGNLKKLEKAYEDTVKALTKSKVGLHKALDTGDISKSTGLEMFVKEFEQAKKAMMKQAMDTPFAEELMQRFFKVDMKHFRMQDMEIGSYDKGVKDKDIKKQVDDYVKDVKDTSKKLKELEKEFKNAQVSGLDDYAEKLAQDISKAKQKMVGLLNVDPHMIFPDDKKSRLDLKRTAKDIADAMDEAGKMANLKFEDNQKNKGLSKFIDDYKKNLKEIESLEVKLATAMNSEQYDYASKLQDKVNALKEEQLTLKESAKTLSKYEQAMRSASEAEQKSKENVDLHNSYLENKNKIDKEKADAKLMAQQQKESDRKKATEIKSMKDSQKKYWDDMLRYEDEVAKGYATVTEKLASKQNAYTQALANDNTGQIDSLEKSIDFWNEKKNELMAQIQNSNFTSDFYDKIKDVDKSNNLFVGEFEGKLADTINKKAEKENKLKEDTLIKAYEKMSRHLAEKENQLLKAVMSDDADQIKAFEDSVKKYEDDINGLLNKIDFSSFSNKFKEEFARIDLDNGRTQSEFVAKLDDDLRKKLVRDNENLQKSLLAEYKNISQAISQKEGDLIKAVTNDSEHSAKAFEDTLDKLHKNYEDVVSKIKRSGLEDVLKDQLKEIDDIGSLKLNELTGSMTDKVLAQSLKEENAEIKRITAEYIANIKELSRRKKELMSTEEGGKAGVAIQKRIDVLEKERLALQENIKGYDNWTKTFKTLLSMRRNVVSQDKINESQYADKVAKQTGVEQEKILTQIAKEKEKLAKIIEKEQKTVMDTYEQYARLQQQAQKQYVSAIVNDDISKAQELDKAVEYYSDLKSKILHQIKNQGLDKIFGDELKSIDKKLDLDLNIHTGGMSDKLSKQQSREDEKALKEYVKTYEDLYKRITEEKLKASKLGVQDRDIEAQAHRENRANLEAELKMHEEKARALKHSSKALEEMSNIQKHYDNNFNLGMANVSQDIQVKSYKEFIKEQDAMVSRYKELSNKQQQFEKDLSTANSPELFNKLKKDIEEVGRELSQLDSKIINGSHKEQISIFNSDKAMSQSKEIAKAIDKIKNEAKSLLTVVGELSGSDYVDKESLAMVEKSLKGLSSTNLDGSIGDVRQLNVQLSQTKELLEHIQTSKVDNIFQSNKKIKLDDISEQIKKFKNDFEHALDTKSVRALEESFERLAKTMDKDSFSQGAKELVSQLKHARNEMEQLTYTSDKYNFFEDLYDNMRTYQLGDLIVDGIQDALSNVKQIVIEMDTAMANVRKVADPIDVNTTSKLDEIKMKAIEVSKEVGMASSDVINSIADTIQSGGYRMEEAIEIARQTMMLANVGEMSAESATKGVVSMLAGFNLSPLREMSVEVGGVTKKTNELTDAMDKINHVGNNFAISTEGIINAMQSGGTVLNAYGVSMNDTIALITGANKTLQDPNVVKFLDVSNRNICYYYWAKSV